MSRQSRYGACTRPSYLEDSIGKEEYGEGQKILGVRNVQVIFQPIELQAVIFGKVSITYIGRKVTSAYPRAGER